MRLKGPDRGLPLYAQAEEMLLDRIEGLTLLKKPFRAEEPRNSRQRLHSRGDSAIPEMEWGFQFRP